MKCLKQKMKNLKDILNGVRAQQRDWLINLEQQQINNKGGYMNIFLPYETDITKSVQALDDKRLNKQILEVKQILDVTMGKSAGYANHPVTQWYKKYPKFLIEYFANCLTEYKFRFGKEHKYTDIGRKYLPIIGFGIYIKWEPYYAEGSKSNPNYIRTTKNVSKLFQQKLCNKWHNDITKGRPPKWTNRRKPEFWEE